MTKVFVIDDSIAVRKGFKTILSQIDDIVNFWYKFQNKEEIIYRYCTNISAVFFRWERFLSFINKEYDRFDHYQARVSFARAKEYDFILPSKSKRIKLQDFAHPAIEKPVPISMDFKKQIMLVTGVNAGGKTMLLKSVLSAVYMSKYTSVSRCACLSMNRFINVSKKSDICQVGLH